MELKNYDYNTMGLKVSKSSITIKNLDTLKTCGVIRGVKTWESMQNSNIARDLFDCRNILKEKLKDTELDMTEVQKNCILVKGELFYLYNIKPYLMYKNQYEHINNKYNQVQEIKKYINVIEFINY